MRVLIVEDDVALGLFLKKGFSLEGHDVKLASDGAAAVDLGLLRTLDGVSAVAAAARSRQRARAKPGANGAG